MHGHRKKTGHRPPSPPPRKVRRRLGPRVVFNLLFGHTQDGVVPNTSAARWEAVEEAVKVWPLDYDHTSILRSPETSGILNHAFAGASR